MGPEEAPWRLLCPRASKSMFCEENLGTLGCSAASSQALLSFWSLEWELGPPNVPVPKQSVQLMRRATARFGIFFRLVPKSSRVESLDRWH